MSKAVQFRRGTSQDHLTFTGLEGEVTVDTTKNTAVVHDQNTAGGMPLAREDMGNVSVNDIADKGIAKSDLSNVDLSDIDTQGIAKKDMSNVSVDDVASLGVAKTDLSNLESSADASDTSKGVVQLASDLEVISGIDTTKVATPSGVKSAISNYLSLPKNYITGLMPSNSADAYHDITISAGECRDSSDSLDMFLTLPLTKQLDAVWGEGDNQGGLASSLTLSANTEYHLFVIAKDDGSVDAGFDTSLTAVNLLADATGYIKYRRVGSFVTDASSDLIPFTSYQKASGELFVEYDDSGILDIDYTSSPPDVQTVADLSVPANVKAKVNYTVYLSSTTQLIMARIYETNKSDETLSLQNSQATSSGASVASPYEGFVKVDNNSQVNIKVNTTGSAVSLTCRTLGYIDERIS